MEKLIDINALSKYHENISVILDGKANTSAITEIENVIVENERVTSEALTTLNTELSNKQDKIEDLDAIRSGATLGATALQSVPSEYVTETELNNKGYLTSVPSEYVTETELTNKDYATTSQVNAKQDTLVSGTNIKTVNGISILGSGDLTITTGENNVQANWNETNTSSDAYIQNKPSIPTSSTIESWGFTKNTGTYSKPSGGIPKSDLSSEVQTSLGKADVAEENAKNYADELNASMNNRVTVIESWGFATNADVDEILNGTYTPSPEEPNQSTGTITENNSIVIDETQLENGSYKLRYIDSEDNIIENFNEITTFEINK